MSIDNISLLSAQAAYTKINDQSISSELAGVKDASSFQNMVNISFNNFAKMTPDQILSHITQVRGNGVVSPASAQSGVAESVIGELRKKVGAQENIIRKSLINEASFTDLLTTTNEAKTNLQAMVTVRDKFLEAFEKVMNMSI
jgi:flagellar hook-basal body complex protein FliE